MTDAKGRFSVRIPDGDNRERLVCEDCGFVRYENPRIIVGSVVTHGDRFLICRRAIDPRHGYWTLPAGFMELGETPEEGAMREAMEEALATIRVKELLAVYTVRHISQVQLFYRAELADERIAPGPESLEVKLVTWDEIPWDDLAFPSVKWALEDHRRALAGELALPSRRVSTPRDRVA
jgi:ADP-ribose pyrophosphatase YjhB (NUDIX family)